jgi:hypothetical protein
VWAVDKRGRALVGAAADENENIQTIMEME